MSIAKKVVACFVLFGLFVGAAATMYIAQREYQMALDNLSGRALAQVSNHPGLQLYIYRREESRLKKILGNFLQDEAVISAIAYSNLGEVLATTYLENPTSPPPPSLESIRADYSVTETSLVAFDQESQLPGSGFWSAALTTNPTAYLTMPVISAVNPIAGNLSITEFIAALSEPEANNSLVVIGYISLEVDRSAVMRDIRPNVNQFFLGSLGILMLSSLTLYLIVRRTIASLSQLSRLARQILSGDDENKSESRRPDDFSAITKVLNSVIEDASSRRHEVALEHKLLLLKSEERASQLFLRDKELSRVTEEVSATREQLHRLANYDRLTSLPNFQLFTEQLNLLLRLCARNARPLALLFLNLDNFHRINESLGRESGDLLLQEVGKRLVGCLRSSDVLAHYVNSNDGLNVSRLGSDEFAMVLSQLDSIDSVELIARRVTARLLEPLSIAGHELVVNPSIGISVAPRNGMDAEGLLRSACTAMHHAKSSSDHHFLFYSEDMEDSGLDDLEMEAALRKAIDRNELSLHYQPQVDTSNGSIICAEALLRWEHPVYGQVSPARFIAMAEKMGLIWEIGDWVLVEACRQMKAFRDEGLELPRIAINISPQQFKPAFVTRLREVLQAAELSPALLELGLSEVVLMDNDSNVLKFLRELKATGVYLSLENFGTNHAPISYLSRHPLDEIKIDRSFVLDCDKRKDAASLVKAVIAMARSLELHTVAEGVETEGEFRFLADNGVGVMRGYLFSKPVPAAELRKFLVVPWHFMGQLQRMALTAELTSPSRTL